jgi:glycosyltransferase involved in cell wall biosynthesis
MSARTDVAVVVPTLNGGRDLAALLDAIAAQEGPFRPVIVAIDSGSTDGSLDALRARGARILSVKAADFNHGATRNEALRSVDGEFAVLIVQDALPDLALVGSARRASGRGPVACRDLGARSSPGCQQIISTRCRNGLGPRALRTVDRLARQIAPGERHEACADNVCSCIRMSVWRGIPSHRFAEDL